MAQNDCTLSEPIGLGLCRGDSTLDLHESEDTRRLAVDGNAGERRQPNAQHRLAFAVEAGGAGASRRDSLAQSSKAEPISPGLRQNGRRSESPPALDDTARFNARALQR